MHSYYHRKMDYQTNLRYSIWSQRTEELLHVLLLISSAVNNLVDQGNFW